LSLVTLKTHTMKTKQFLQIFFLTTLFLFVQNVYAQFDGGTGTPEDPYLISTADQLNAIRNSQGENRSYKLTQDIDLGAWIATNADPDIQTNGWLPIDVARKILDGDGHKITGFWYHRTTGNGLGLFHQVNVEIADNEYGNEAIIKNLTIEIDITQKIIGNANTAALIGIVNGNEDSAVPVQIINCHVKGDIESNGTAGGLVGRTQAPLELIDCSFTGTIKSKNDWDSPVGGLIGQKYEGRASFLIKGCSVTNSSITSVHSNVGGIGGVIGPNATIEDCSVETTTITSVGVAGGLIGNWGNRAVADNFRFASILKNSHSTASVTGDQHIGGLIGKVEVRPGTISEEAEERALAFDIINCYAEGDLAGSSNIGGLVGSYVSNGDLTIDGSMIDSCWTKVTVTSSYGEVGGLVGNSAGCKNLEVKNSHSEIKNTIQWGGNVGGLVGTFGASEGDNSHLFNCYATGSITGSDVGGLVSQYKSAGSIQNCYATDTITGGGNLGGLIASINTTGDYPLQIINCYRTGNVGNSICAFAGGLVGLFDSGSGSIIDSCRVEGDVTNSYNASGGLVGSSAASKNLTISHSYFIGNVLGGNYAGGLAGIFGAGETDGSAIRDSYVLGNIKGDHSGGLVGKHQSTGLIEKAFVAGHITGGYWSDNVSGGGLISDASYPFTLSQSYASGSAIGYHNVGGLVGRYLAGAGGSVIENCYTLDSITGEYGTNGIGGLVGNVAVADDESNILINNSFALNPSITADGAKGVLVGGGDAKVTATGCYAYSGLNTVAANTAIATFIDKAAIVSQTTYESKGWDFDNTWVWGNEYYRLPVLKDLAGQPVMQPEHLPLSGNAALNALALSKGTLTPDFAPETFTYTAEVLHAVENITITATAPEEDNAIVTGTGEQALEEGDNVFTVHVAAEDQVTTADYTVTVHRISALADAALSALSVSEGTLTPAFDPETEQYTVSVAFPVESIDITATANNGNATLTGTGTQPLAVGPNTLTVIVTSEDGTTTKNYVILVTRTAAATDATLKSLTATPGTMTPAFSASVTDYTVNVANAVTSITLTAVANDANATLTGDGLKDDLVIGDNDFDIVVTAEDVTVTKTYHVKVVRASGTAINHPDSKVRFYTTAQTIVVEGAEGTIILTDVAGVSQKFISQGTQTRIPVPAKGVYLLTVNKVTYKVIMSYEL
jgi:hypothetical protein